MKCKGDYNVNTDYYCGWFGPADECETLNGSLICPVCGSDVEDMEEK